MAQDRISYLAQRLEEGAAVAFVLRAAHSAINAPRDDDPVRKMEWFQELERAVHNLWDAAYIELPDY